MSKNRIAILIKYVSLKFDKLSNPILSEYDLTTAQYRVLKFLYSQQEKLARVVDVEKECSIRHPTALGLIDNLEKKGFVKKMVNPQDARSKVIILTDKAKNLQTELEEVGDRIEDVLTDNLTEEEKFELLGLLEKILKEESVGDQIG